MYEVTREPQSSRVDMIEAQTTVSGIEIRIALAGLLDDDNLNNQ